MTFDYKKEYKEFYIPKTKPEIIEIPSMNFAAVSGTGDPNEENGEYKFAINLIYGVIYTIKMSPKANHSINGYFNFVAPPLEGFWWQEGINGIDYSHKESLHWISLIRLPDFVTSDDFNWALDNASKKKKLDFTKVQFYTYTEGLCVQCMHIGSYDNEPETVAEMEDYIKSKGYHIDITPSRFHHEIYLNDPRKCNPSKLKTIIRHPIKKVDGF